MEFELKVCQIIWDSLEDTNLELFDDTSLESLSFDSITFIKCVVDIETAFEFEFDDDMLLLSAFNVVGDLVGYVKKKVGIG